jgi:hypothetical protein
MISGELLWESNGVIYSRSSPRNRWVFYESDNIDPLFGGIENLIGAPLNHIVIESRRREARKYLERAFPLEVRQLLHDRDDPTPLTEEERGTRFTVSKNITISVHDVARVFGYGDLTPGELWEAGDEHPWRSTNVRHPYSLPFQVAESLGSCEAFEGRDLWVDYRRTGDDTYRFDSFVSDHPLELKERLKRRHYDFKPGDLAYERCPGCGLPHEITRYLWDLDKGTIADPDTGRRMAVFGPYSLDSVFDDLADELGEAIPQTIIEAQRRYIKEAWSKDEWKRGAPDFQRLLALRGLGNLTGFEGDRSYLEVRISNSCLHLPMVGIVQALVEMVYNAEHTECTWELHDDGDLIVSVHL